MIDINEYNRRDIIASCLLEAVDIMKEQEEYDNYNNNELLYEDELYESAGRNGVYGRLQDAKIKNLEKRIDRINRSDSYDDNLKNKKLERLKNEVDTERLYKRRIDGQSKKFGRKAAEYYGMSKKNENNGNMNRADYFHEYGDSYKNLGIRDAESSKKLSDGHLNDYDNRGVDRYNRSNRKVSPIHKKINDRAAKSMNESAYYDDIELADMILDIID